MFVLGFLHVHVALNIIGVLVPPLFTTTSLVQQLQMAGVVVISADLAVRLVKTRRVAKGQGDGRDVRDGGGVPRRRGQGPWVPIGNGIG